MIPEMDIEYSLNHGAVLLDQLNQVYQGFPKLELTQFKVPFKHHGLNMSKIILKDISKMSKILKCSLIEINFISTFAKLSRPGCLNDSFVAFLLSIF